ncbi:reverse transcriptase [Senna tora]|uniref:Reverse transcriptase n=1 Tax=Senna tora TaxID=362788 RepID=A0A834WB31_9FABA|nr:reverse transcriptase [Senna tora]
MESISILAWDVRGAASVEFKRIFRDLIRQHEPNVVLLTKTQVGGQKARQIISNLGYSKYHTVEPMGYAGGLWVLWNENQISLRMIEDTFQEIHASVDVNGSPIALVSFVYGSPSRHRRKILWENLVNLSTVHNLPWLVGGDFNEILSPDEKWGVVDAWNSDHSLSNALTILKDKVISWNKYSLGNIFVKKKTLLKRLNGIGHALNARPSPQLAILEQNLSNQYREILLMEEELWASKARLG